ncbi:MAG: hypothetical protein JRI59_01205 [Deltaproteobacteria bacterium]|nr:hypothetical protein [Deltaproteobacteria bacterium]
MYYRRSSFGKQGLTGALLAALVFCLGCAATPPYRPSAVGIKRVLLVGFPGQVYDEQNNPSPVLTLAATKLAAASNFEVQADPRDLSDLGLVTRGRRGEPCLTFKTEVRRESAVVNKTKVIALAREKQVDAVMIGGFKLSESEGLSIHESEGQGNRLALSRRDMDREARRILGDAESDVILEAILVAADGSCRWHGEMETSLDLATGLKSVVGFGLAPEQVVAYERLERGLTHLFMTLPKPQ